MEEFLKKQKERKEIHKKFKKRIENQELKTLFARIHRINNELNKESGNLNPTNYTTRIQSVQKLREKKNQIQKEIIKIYNANKIQQKIYQNDSTTRSPTEHPRNKRDKCPGKSDQWDSESNYIRTRTRKNSSEFRRIRKDPYSVKGTKKERKRNDDQKKN